MKRNRNLITLALVATALFFAGIEANASEPNAESLSQLSVEVSKASPANTSLNPMAGYTGRKMTTNRPVSPQAPQFVSPPSVARSVTADFRPGRITSHKPVSPKAPTAPSPASAMVASI